MQCEKKNHSTEKSAQSEVPKPPPLKGRPLDATDFSGADRRRLWAGVSIKGENECWEWTGVIIKDGYGQFHHKGANLLAHRVIFAVTHGRCDGPARICHTCDNPPCCNPNHLWSGTQKENTQDMINKGRRVSSAGEMNPNAKLNTNQVIEIRNQHKAGASNKDLAAKYGIGLNTLYEIITRRSWRHV